MQRRTTALQIGGCLALALTGLASADPLEDGVAAYRQGDFAAAMRLLRPLADAGDAKAEFHLGRMYALGQGVGQDPRQAVAWYRKAAERGDAEAEFVLGVMSLDRSGASQDAGQAVAWLRKAADKGVFNAQFRLGMMYAKGASGLEPDPIAARMWLSLAAERAENAYVHALVTKERSKLSAGMTPAEIAEAQRRAIEWRAK
ncbi:MAG: tetratricopeptide repeat protein [Roseiarcus sp.]|uniref:tetratricopeptide repeat protein n=2 Tax=Roseiarcus sp. TaxID=1969460 RepID=UPI003BB1649D